MKKTAYKILILLAIITITGLIYSLKKAHVDLPNSKINRYQKQPKIEVYDMYDYGDGKKVFADNRQDDLSREEAIDRFNHMFDGLK